MWKGYCLRPVRWKWDNGSGMSIDGMVLPVEIEKIKQGEETEQYELV